LLLTVVARAVVVARELVGALGNHNDQPGGDRMSDGMLHTTVTIM